MKKKSIFSQISTKPSPDSTKWAGKERSLLATVLLWSLWVCRVASLLQICKLIFRRVALAIKRATTDKKATRVNVPPVFCEIYYILWSAAMIGIYFLNLRGTAVNIAAGYYLFETVVWVLYYTVFRRFYEENYSIYHELEYLTVLILIIPTQATAFAILYNVGFTDVIAGLLGAADDLTPLPVKILGALFSAIAISLIISAFPTESVKKAYNKSKAFIVGGGDVVVNRLYPALTHAERPYGKTEVWDIDGEGKPDYVRVAEDTEALTAHLKEAVDDDSVVWIETPTSTHSGYLKAMLDTPAAMIVLEKPVARTAEDIEEIKKIVANEEKRDRIFFLSYYNLEKALPLNMLCGYREGYVRYLDIEDEYLTKNWRIVIGTLTRAEVIVHEGADSREWVRSDGGHLFETFIHNLLIASLIAGRPSTWENASVSQSEENGVETVSLTASVMGAPVVLSQKKGVSDGEKRRYARFEFTDGLIEVDLEGESATVYLYKIGKRFTVSVKELDKRKYSIMADLVMRCYLGELHSREVDGLDNQIECLEWLAALVAE